MKFYAKGNRFDPVEVEVTLHHNLFVASAEDEHLTERQFLDAVQNSFPDYEVISLGGRGGFWYARGEKVR